MSMYDNEPDCFDVYDKEVNEIVYLFKKLTTNDLATTYTRHSRMVTVLQSIKETDSRIYDEIVDAVKKMSAYQL